ncbi:hypothetical protein O3P69_007294 [Scylla paramamosain]|uniref:Uncharacterized protein n=1 Tax=Scylla paramamosain TaxID=85552 RepID=A0AAW0V2K6_SCYPA
MTSRHIYMHLSRTACLTASTPRRIRAPPPRPAAVRHARHSLSLHPPVREIISLPHPLNSNRKITLQFVMSETLVSDKSGCCRRVARVLFSHIGLFVLVALYAVLGAYLFIAVEEDHEEKLRQNKKRVSLDLIDAKNYIVKLLVYNRDKNLTKSKYIDMASPKLLLFLLLFLDH